MGGVVRCREYVDGSAGIVRAAEFWVDRVGADVGADQGGSIARLGSGRVESPVQRAAAKCRRYNVTSFHILK